MDTDEKWCWHSVVRQIKRFRIYLRNSKSVFIRVYPWFSFIVANRSTSDQFLKVFRIARALQRDLVGGGVDFTEVVWSQTAPFRSFSRCIRTTVSATPPSAAAASPRSRIRTAR